MIVEAVVDIYLKILKKLKVGCKIVFFFSEKLYFSENIEDLKRKYVVDVSFVLMQAKKCVYYIHYVLRLSIVTLDLQFMLKLYFSLTYTCIPDH